MCIIFPYSSKSSTHYMIWIYIHFACVVFFVRMAPSFTFPFYFQLVLVTTLSCKSVQTDVASHFPLKCITTDAVNSDRVTTKCLCILYVDAVCVYDYAITLPRSPAFSSKAEEIALITEICKALIHNLVPKHLWEPNIYSCVLQEILSMKG